MVEAAAKKIYVVIGARGGTGAQLVHRLSERTAEQVGEIRAIVRDPSTIEAGLLPNDDRVKLIAGDVTRPDSLVEPFHGADVVFYAAAGTTYNTCLAVDEIGLGTTAAKAKEAGVRRMVMISSQVVHPDNKWAFSRIMINTIFTGFFAFRGVMDMKWEGERLLRKSGQEYTIVRPGRLRYGRYKSAQP